METVLLFPLMHIRWLKFQRMYARSFFGHFVWSKLLSTDFRCTYNQNIFSKYIYLLSEIRDHVYKQPAKQKLRKREKRKMADLLASIYPLVKTLHIISVISWMAGLLYLPRLFVNHVEHGPVGSETSTVLKGMEERLMRIIMAPAMIATWVFGLCLAFTPGIVDWSAFYPWIKAVMVILMTGYHHWLIKVRKEFAEDRNTRPAKTYRIANEVPTLLMVIIVAMIVVKPF